MRHSPFSIVMANLLTSCARDRCQAPRASYSSIPAIGIATSCSPTGSPSSSYVTIDFSGVQRRCASTVRNSRATLALLGFAFIASRKLATIPDADSPAWGGWGS